MHIYAPSETTTFTKQTIRGEWTHRQIYTNNQKFNPVKTQARYNSRLENMGIGESNERPKQHKQYGRSYGYISNFSP